jgi:fibronectin type 3 domain-containing protein
MAFRKHVMITAVLLSISGLFLGCSSDKAVTPIPVTEAPLIAPSNVTATRTADGYISLRWDHNTQAHFMGYNVYRLSEQETQIGRLNDDPLAVNSYLDTDTNTYGRYQYWVTAVSVKNVESAYSAAAEAYVPRPRNEPKEPKIKD